MEDAATKEPATEEAASEEAAAEGGGLNYGDQRSAKVGEQVWFFYDDDWYIKPN